VVTREAPEFRKELEAAFTDAGYAVSSSDGAWVEIEYWYELNPVAEQNDAGRSASWKTKHQSG
jgi:hypothetical protein